MASLHHPPGALRALFVNENIGGNATMHQHLRGALASDHPDVAATFLDVPRRGPLRRLAGAAIPGLAPLDLDFSAARAQLALSAHVARRLRRSAGTFDVLHVYTHNAALLSAGTLRRHPTVVGLDATTAQSTKLLPYRAPTRFTALSTLPSRLLERRVYESADVIVAKSMWARASLLDDYGVEPDRIRVIPYGIEVPDVPPVPRHDDRIVFVGRSMARKGGWLLLELWRRRLRRDAQLVLVTPEPVPEEPGLTVHRDLTPRDPRLLDVLAGASVLAFPSGGDTFGYAALEAMAMSTPVVAFGAAAVPELVAHDDTGLIIEPENGEAFADALASLLGDPGRARAMGQRSRDRVLERFDARITTTSLVELLREVQGGSGRN